MEAEEGALEPLNNCGHAFHSSCLHDYFEAEVQSNSLPIQCPQSTCQAEVASIDIRSQMNEWEFDRYLNLSLSHFVGTNREKIRVCPTPDCQYVFEYNGETDFRCEACRTRYCLKCMTAFHRGMTCEEYRLSKDGQFLDQEFEKFAKGHHFKQCSNCKFWVEKTEGCDHMVCKCGYHFCYRCGGRYRACHCRSS